MITVKNKKMLSALPSTPKNGEFALLEDTQQVYVYNKNEWQRVGKTQGGITTKLYDINATAIAQLPPHNDSLLTLAEDIEIINNFVEKYVEGQYFTLFTKEVSSGAFYSTILHRLSKASKYTGEIPQETVGAAVISCLKNVGTIHALTEEADHLEIWVKENDNMVCFIFFNSDEMFIEVK